MTTVHSLPQENLQQWAKQHSRHARILQLAQTDWPGVHDVAEAFQSRREGGVDHAAALCAALDAYESAREQRRSDWDRLHAFLGTLLAPLPAAFRADFLSTLPRNFQRILEACHG